MRKWTKCSASGSSINYMTSRELAQLNLQPGLNQGPVGPTRAGHATTLPRQRDKHFTFCIIAIFVVATELPVLYLDTKALTFF